MNKNIKAIKVIENKKKILIPFPKDTFINNGCETVFVQLNKTVGIKLFNNKDHAERSLMRQRLAYTNNVAPRIYSNVLLLEVTTGVRKYKTCRMWGYKTQVARVKKCEICDTFSDDKHCKHCKDRIELTRGIEMSISKRLTNIGLSAGDLHDGNVGKIGNRYVMIDFGDLSS